MKNFMLEEIRGFRKNRYIIEDFNLEMRAIYNKSPKQNNEPMLEVSLVIGGQYVPDSHHPLQEAEGNSKFKITKMQITSILKFLNYSQKYTEFQVGVQKKFLLKKPKPDEVREYMKMYEDYKKNETNQKLSEKNREKLGRHFLLFCSNLEIAEFEKDYTYETIAEIRQKTINKYTFKAKRDKARKQLDQEIENYKNSKRQGMIGRMFSAKTEEEKQQDEDDIENFIEEKEYEFKEKWDKERKDLLEQEPIFDIGTPPSNMPQNWVMIEATLVIPNLKFYILKSREERYKKITKIETTGLVTTIKYGPSLIGGEIKLGTLNVKDYVSGSLQYPFLTHTVFEGDADRNYTFEIEALYTNSEEMNTLDITSRSYGRQYIIVNLVLINALQDFFKVEEEKLDLSYYEDLVKAQAIDVINQGADFISKTSNKEKEVIKAQEEDQIYLRLNLNIDILTPVIFIPETLKGDYENEVLILD
jgi:hypothetical protein